MLSIAGPDRLLLGPTGHRRNLTLQALCRNGILISRVDRTHSLRGGMRDATETGQAMDSSMTNIETVLRELIDEVWIF